MAAVLVEVPVIVVRLVEEVQAVEAFDPADFHFHVEVFLVVVEAAAFLRFLELVHADGVSLGNHGPVGRVAVDARNLVGGKLEDLVFDAGPLDGKAVDGECEEKQDCPIGGNSHDCQSYVIIRVHPKLSPLLRRIDRLETNPESISMNAERWRQIEDIVHGALDQDVGARSAFLDSACGSDAALRREVESLLGFQTQADGLLAGAVRDAAEQVAEERSAAFEGQRIGVYRVLGEIGRGGMGTVLLADRDDDQFHKQVAIKLVTRGMDTALLLERFRHERQILARLDHPYIARLLDGGGTEQGLPYLVMEYVEGVNIATYCAEHALGLKDRIELFRKVCAAVHYAHQNLVVHRDLKPGNILVTDEGTPKLLDFGIAKLMGPREGPQATPATAVQQMMTPDYASPEQVRGEPVTTATDVYSLGAILYELVTGDPPAPDQVLHSARDRARHLRGSAADAERRLPGAAARRPGQHHPDGSAEGAGATLRIGGGFLRATWSGIWRACP